MSGCKRCSQADYLAELEREVALRAVIADLKARLKAARSTRSTDRLVRITDLRVKNWRKP